LNEYAKDVKDIYTEIWIKEKKLSSNEGTSQNEILKK